MENEGQIIIDLVEDYKANQGQLPESLGDIGYEENMGEGPYYEIMDSSECRVYFTIGFDELYQYRSGKNQWDKFPRLQPRL